MCNPNATAAVDLISWKIGNYLSNNNSSALLVRYSDLGPGAQAYICFVTFGDTLLQQTRKFTIEPSPGREHIYIEDHVYFRVPRFSPSPLTFRATIKHSSSIYFDTSKCYSTHWWEHNTVLCCRGHPGTNNIMA